jgi:hypothetical protein
MKCGVEGVIGNREVPRIGFLEVRADPRGAWLEACMEEEGSRGKHSFLRATEPEAEEAA